jgi:hypothetical protein
MSFAGARLSVCERDRQRRHRTVRANRVEIPERDYRMLSTLDDAVAHLLAAQLGNAGTDT